MFYTKLETSRPILKNVSYEDREFVFRQFSSDEINGFPFDAEPIVDMHGADETINFYSEQEPSAHHRWILVKKDDGSRIGTRGFHCWDRIKNTCDVGYDLLPSYWGKGMYE